MHRSKICSRCGAEKALTHENWLPRKNSKDGYRGVCRTCWYEQQRPNKRRHYHRNAERLREERRQYRRQHPERARLSDARYHLRHLERRRQYSRQYYWRTHDRRLAYARWYAANVRPLRIDGLETSRTVDLYRWQEQQYCIEQQSAAAELLDDIMATITDDKKEFLEVFESCGYDVGQTAERLGLSPDDALSILSSIRSIAVKVRRGR